MTYLKVWIAASLTAAGVWASGPQTAATRPRPATGSTAKRVTVQPKLSDAQLEAVIRAKFAKSKINADKFTVRVQGGNGSCVQRFIKRDADIQPQRLEDIAEAS